MAKAKQKAAKRTAVARGANLPKGYEAIGGFSESWKPEKAGDSIEGTVSGFRDVEVTRGKKKEASRIMEIECKDGKTRSVWHSAGLNSLFERAEEGSQVYIRFEGMGKAKRGQNAPRLYTCGIK